ncbi:MAG: hypothetical protein QXS81_05005 [Candidatus Micrarchaeaceae archaeon]
MTTQKTKDKKEQQTLAILFITIGFGLGGLLYFVMGFPNALLGAVGIVILVSILYLVGLFGISYEVDLNGPYYHTSPNPKYAVLIPALVVGMIVGIFIFFFISPASHVAPSPSYYQGIVQGIGTGPHNNYVQFTSGTTLDGNVSNISNLSIGATCKLLLYPGSALLFINGTCER